MAVVGDYGWEIYELKSAYRLGAKLFIGQHLGAFDMFAKQSAGTADSGKMHIRFL